MVERGGRPRQGTRSPPHNTVQGRCRGLTAAGVSARGASNTGQRPTPQHPRRRWQATPPTEDPPRGAGPQAVSTRHRPGCNTTPSPPAATPNFHGRHGDRPLQGTRSPPHDTVQGRCRGLTAAGVSARGASNTGRRPTPQHPRRRWQATPPTEDPPRGAGPQAVSPRHRPGCPPGRLNRSPASPPEAPAAAAHTPGKERNRSPHRPG